VTDVDPQVTDQPAARTNSLGTPDQEPVQTDNGPKPGDAEVDQESVRLPATGELEGAGLAGAVLSTALRHRGTIESPLGSNRQKFGAAYGWNGVAWCNIFVSRVGFEVTGDYRLLGKFAWTVGCATWWDQQGRFGTQPRPGAAVFFDWDGGRSITAIDHIGLVVEPLANGLVRTIEGNAAVAGRTDGVWVHDRSPRFIVGYGYPRYTPGAGGAGPAGPGATTKAKAEARASGRGSAQQGVAARRGGPPAYPGLLRQRSTGPAVRTLQHRLRERGWRLTVDGEFGPETLRVVRGFQRDKGLAVDGEVGPVTWSALWTAPVT